ncbi:MAG: hypothetical protein COA78_31675 [Blastopirellula sp.]|nr:MAG: hypothetical protein COA78_31675 [Blastopirellula sp.]
MIEFDLGGAGVSFPFRTHRLYLVGLGDVHMAINLAMLENNGLMVEQIITNKTDPPEMLDLRCNLLVRGRRRQTRNKDGIASGQTAKIIYLIRDYDQLKEKAIWLRAIQKNGQRSLNEILNEEQILRLLEKKKEAKKNQLTKRAQHKDIAEKIKQLKQPPNSTVETPPALSSKKQRADLTPANQ